MSFSDGLLSGFSSGVSDIDSTNVGSIMGQSFGTEIKRISAQTGPQAFKGLKKLGRWFLRKTLLRGRANRERQVVNLAQEYVEAAANVSAKHNAPYIFQSALFLVGRMDQRLSSDPPQISLKEAIRSLQTSTQRLSAFDKQLQSARKDQTNALAASISQAQYSPPLGGLS